MITAFLAAPAGVALQALLVGTLLTFLLGVIAAVRDGTFSLR
jgi:TRAP-type mannitol/chloroaromatic compound transport system permease large subunit